MHIIDIIVLIFVGLGLIEGFRKGIIFQISSLIGVILGLYGAVHFSDKMVEFLNNFIDINTNTLKYIALLATFILVYWIIQLIGNALDKVLKAVFLGTTNKVIGAILGGIKSLIIISVFVYGFSYLNNAFAIIPDSKLETSKVYKPIKETVSTLFPKVKEWYNNNKRNIKNKFTEPPKI